MKIILSRPELAALIGKIQSIVSSKPTIPILANILLEASNDQITISATDLTVSMQIHMDAKILEEGAITIPARRFFQLTREITAPEITIECTPGEIVLIQAGSSKFRLNGIHKSEFPALPALTHGQNFSLTGTTFKEMLSKSVFAAAKEDSRHVLNGVLMHIEKGQATFIGTDGKRLAKIFTPIELDQEHKQDYLVPLKAVEEMVKMVEGDEMLKINLLPDKISMETPNISFIAKLLSGEYPDVERIIPRNAESLISLHKEELMSLLKQVSLFTNDKSHSVHFTFKPGELVLTANSSDIGDGKVSMPVNYSGEAFEIAFNPFFFHDILRHCKDETVSFALSNPHNPGLITDSTSAEYVIMPMRLNSV